MKQIGFIGLGRMGSNMVRRLTDAGISCAVYDANADAVKALQGPLITGADSLEQFIASLPAPRAVWIIVPAAVVYG